MPKLDGPHSLELLDAEQQRLCERLAELTRGELETASNLPGWLVLDLAAHVTRVCESIWLAVQRATLGDRTPAFGPAAVPRQAEIRAMDPPRWVALQRDSYQRLVWLVGGLADEQRMRLTFPHPQGERSIEWFCTQLLAEVAYHRWDLNRSLGDTGPIESELASYLLPFLLDPEQHLFRLRRSRGELQTFSIATATAMGGWTLTSDAEGTRVRAGSTGEGTRITAPAEWLGLALYGRIRVDAPEFRVVGPSQTADRFAAIFGPP